MATLKFTHAPTPVTSRGCPTRIYSSPKNDKLVYASGSNIYVRDLENPVDVEVYNEHTVNTTVARISPSGFYCASADSHGNVRVWDVTQSEHVNKAELTILSGPILDLQWSPDSGRIVVAGDGRETMGAVFMFDTGNTVGSIGGHSKKILGCDYKPTRPFRIATASEDTQVNFYEGPPFKYSFANKDHSRFANAVRFAPDGERFISVGSDYKGYVFAGKTGEKIGEFSTGADAHKSSILDAAWNADGTKLVTVANDKTAKIWDTNTWAVLKTFTLAEKPAVDDMQVGCSWAGERIVTLSLSGAINYFTEADERPNRTIQGHNKEIRGLALDSESGLLYSGSYDGRVLTWQPGVTDAPPLPGKSATGSGVTAVHVDQGSKLLMNATMDDNLQFSSLSGGDNPEKIDTPGAVLSMDSTPTGGLVVAATGRGLLLVRNQKIVCEKLVQWGPTSAAVSPDGKTAVFGGEDNKVHVFSVADDKFGDEKGLEKHRGQVTCVAYSPDGSMVVSGDSNRELLVWDTFTWNVKLEGLVHHTARILCVAWSPSSRRFASAGLDQTIIVQDVVTNKRLKTIGAHKNAIQTLCFTSEEVLTSAGADCCVRGWEIPETIA